MPQWATVRVQRIGLDEPQGKEVLVTMRASGVCHTDWDSLHWGRRVILGHEGAGEVLRVGPDVCSCKPGDRVLLHWAVPCGVCFQCQRGKENICEDRGRVPDDRFHEESSPSSGAETLQTARNTGAAGPGRFNASFSLGTMATHALVPEAAVLPLPASVPFEVGAILGCAVMTGFGSAVNAACVAEGRRLLMLHGGSQGTRRQRLPALARW